MTDADRVRLSETMDRCGYDFGRIAGRDDRIFVQDLAVSPSALSLAAIDLRRHVEQQVEYRVRKALQDADLDWPVHIQWYCRATAQQPSADV